MHVTADDGSADWDRPGIFQVTPGVYRIPLPLPHGGLHAVNVYALLDDEGLSLIDGGWATVEARELLGKALVAVDRTPADIRRILVTHMHRDHYSLAVGLRREFGSPVSLGLDEQANLELAADREHGSRGALALLRRCGAGELAQWLSGTRAALANQDPADWAAPDHWLRDGATLHLPARSLDVLHTPGHTRGHVVFADHAAGLLFTGDHVLPHITPSIGFEPAPGPLPLRDFLDSLHLLRQLPDRRLLPAHGPVRPSVHARVDELLDHHGRRLDATHAAATEQATAYQVAQRLTWTRRNRRLDELDQFNQMLAVIEAAMHLDLLVTQGRLGVVEVDGVRRYQAS